MGFLATLLACALIALFYERKRISRDLEDLRAEASLYTALAAAQSLLCKSIALYPDSVTVWEERLPGLGTPGTALHILQRTHPQKVAQVLVRPLLSGAEKLFTDQNPLSFRPSELCNFNQGQWVGGFDGNPLPLFAPWVSLNTKNEHPLLARYAFFIEDESFKLNLQEASPHPSSHILRSAKDLSLKSVLLPETKSRRLHPFATLRKQHLKFQHLEQIRFGLQLNEEEWNQWKFLYTIHSESLNCTRRGLPRININALFGSTSALQTVRQQLDVFISAIRKESPHFGQRFYRPKTADIHQIDAVPPEHEEIYLNKLAANVRDLFAEGPNPTRVLNQPEYPLLSPLHTAAMRPAKGLGSNPLAAIGKKKIPYLQEYALVTRLVSIQPEKKDPQHVANGAKFEMTIDHFLEFWNLSNAPIRAEDLGPGARLILRNQPPWDLDGNHLKGWGIPPSNERDIEIPLTDFQSFQGESLVFPPGQATVLTTFPGIPPPELFPHAARFFAPSKLPKRKFLGTTYRTRKVGESEWYEIRAKLRNSGNADYETEYLLVNDRGWIDGFNYLPILTNIVVRADTGQPIQGIRWHMRSSGLQGNESGSDRAGDPRTLNEQLLLGEFHLSPGRSAALSDIRFLRLNPIPHTRFLETARPNQFPGNSSFGRVRSRYLNLTQWPDPLFIEAGSESCVAAVFPKTPLRSIGELGQIFDPSRGGNVERARGGGRTLRIGQPEFYPSRDQQGIWDRDPLSPSREWAAWRLCDIFSITHRAVLPGTLNINGLLRHEGAILKALLHQFRWNGQGAEDLRGAALEEEDIRFLISHFQKRLRRAPPYESRGGPFFERGEISEIDLFQSKDAFPSEVTNPHRLGLARRADFLREEIVRYLIEAITVRGRVFSAYCIGEAIRREGSGKIRVLATRRGKFTFRLVPRDASGRRLDRQIPQTAIQDKVLKPPFQYSIELLDRE